jgi:cephalosporin-C deacetylase-like acetyl esterase
MSAQQDNVVRKTLLVDPKKLEELRKLFKAKSDSEAVRRAIDETLAYSDTLKAARRIQQRGKFGRS